MVELYFGTKGRIPSKRPPPTFLRNLCLRWGRGVGAYKVLYSTSSDEDEINDPIE